MTHATAANAASLAVILRISASPDRFPGSPKPGMSGSPPTTAAYRPATTTPSIATATRPAIRETALLMPDAAPVSSSSTAVMTALDSGETTSAMPSPISTISGKTPVQNWRTPEPISRARPANAMATTRLPLAIGTRGPIRSASLPTLPDSSAIAADRGRKMNPVCASSTPHPAISSIGRKNRMPESAK